MKKLLFSFSILLFSICCAQRPQIAIAQPPSSDPNVVIFGYDEAGNQVFRGSDTNSCNTCRPSEQTSTSLADEVANKIQAAPVPVRDNLTVLWDLSIQDYIVSVDLLPYNAFTIYETVIIKTLSSNSYVFRMTHLPYGVYYLRFNLSDGSVYTRTVTKN